MRLSSRLSVHCQMVSEFNKNWCALTFWPKLPCGVWEFFCPKNFGRPNIQLHRRSCGKMSLLNIEVAWYKVHCSRHFGWGNVMHAYAIKINLMDDNPFCAWRLWNFRAGGLFHSIQLDHNPSSSEWWILHKLAFDAPGVTFDCLLFYAVWYKAQGNPETLHDLGPWR